MNVTEDTSWRTICAAKKSAQLASIPAEWIIKCLPELESQGSVRGVPARSGLLSERELEITETTDVALLLDRLHSAEWSSVEVTTAFYKRAIIAQQLVRPSVRIPSAFCGLYALRPSYERLPYCGAVNALEGQESISSVLGPMANSMSGVRIFTKSIIDAKPWTKDPVALRKEWSESEYRLYDHGKGHGLCFAIMWDNEVVRPHPPLQRAMAMTKAALEAAGHKVIDWEPHRHLEIYKNAVRILLAIDSLSSHGFVPQETIFVADGGHDYRTQCELSGEPLIETMLPTTDPHPSTLGEPFVKTLVGEASHLSAYDLWQLHKEKRDLRKSHLDHWERTISRTGTGRPVDAIISPAVAYTAVPHGLNTYVAT
ncbi:hypothetical protein C0991_010477 [Blastosporella zonata]|nr:hypothetical protein C0991_010477 [Blastosporella zonata]